ncbi:MAG: J domain-containing protein [Planctomycetaceae bacterium]|nr:J domain-containing protein [Planctomycetaceae bacterium]
MSTADWNKLPHDPLGFFGLAEGFDRKDLKRSYGQLIKQYKPETAPEEFQRIRAAFEYLEGILRYGKQDAQLMGGMSYQWSSQSALTQPGRDGDQPRRSDGSSPPPASSIPLHERLKSESPGTLYRQLQQVENKSPFDYYALALLSDLVKPNENLFYRWLLEGLRAHANDSGLMSLFYEALRTELPVELIPGLLLSTSKIVQTDAFYFLTESAWHRLLIHSPFSQFRRTLEQCEKNINSFRLTGRLAFYLQIMPRAIWKADPDWVDQVFDWIATSGVQIPKQFEGDLDFLEKLRDYHSRLPTVLSNAHPMLEHIIKCVEQYFVGQGLKRDQIVLQNNLDFAEAPLDLLAAFPFSENEAVQQGFWQTWLLWESISADVAERYGVLEGRVSPQQLLPVIHAVLREQSATWIPPAGLRYGYRYSDYVMYPLFFLLPWLMLGGLLPMVYAVCSVMLLLSVGSLLGYHFWIKPKYVDKFWQGRLKQFVTESYYGQWRQRFVQVLEANPVTMKELVVATRAIVSQYDEFRHGQILDSFLSDDIGLAFFATAVRFRR